MYVCVCEVWILVFLFVGLWGKGWGGYIIYRCEEKYGRVGVRVTLIHGNGVMVVKLGLITAVMTVYIY